MIKKLLHGLLLGAISCSVLVSCKKSNNDTSDATRNYFPLKYGKYVTYAVDSIYYNGTECTKYEIKSQMKYSVTDTFKDSRGRINYIIDVFSRPYDGAFWTPTRVITVIPTTTSMLYAQDNAQYIKLMFPIKEGFSWLGNANIDTQNPEFSYLKNWSYEYQNYHKSYNNGVVNFDNTVTVLEDDESVNYPDVDSNVAAYRTYAKEVYAYNVGMVYKEWTHWTYAPNSLGPIKCVDGYTVTMQAIEYN